MNLSLLLRILVCLVVSGGTGCALKAPSLRTLPEEEAGRLKAAFHQALTQTCPTAVDADIRLHHKMMGREISLPGTLQMQDNRLVYRAVDPLGRPLYIVSASNNGFTLVENREALAYAGEWDCGLRRRYLPGDVEPRDLVWWLSGRLKATDVHIRKVGLTSDDRCCWFVVNYDDSMDHYVLMNPLTGLVSRHLLHDPEQDEIKLELDYDDYLADENETCRLPGKITVSGEELPGETVIFLERVYSRDALDDKVFRQSLPEYYHIEEVE